MQMLSCSDDVLSCQDDVEMSHGKADVASEFVSENSVITDSLLALE